MASFCERQEVLALISYKTEIYYDAQKDSVGESMYNDDIEDPLPASNSLDTHQKLIMASNLLKQKHAEAGKGEQAPAPQPKAVGNAPKMQIVSFSEKNDAGKSHKHRKIDLQAAGKFGKTDSPVSHLSATLKDLPSNMMQLKVFFPSGYGEPIQVRVPNVCTAEMVIKAALKKYSEASRTPPLPDDVAQYELRMAESDGTPDEDMPKLGLRAPVNRRLGTMFALCILTSDAPQTKNKMIRIALPNNQKTTIPYHNDHRIGDIVRRLCVKRGLNVADYHLRMSDDVPPLSSATRLSELDGIHELQLCTTSVLGGSEETSTASSWDFGTIQPQTFNVRMVKGLFGSEDRVLSLDAEKISLSKKAKAARAKDQRQVTDLVRVTQNDRTKPSFVLEWSDGKQDRLEADSAQSARQIISALETVKAKCGSK